MVMTMIQTKGKFLCWREKKDKIAIGSIFRWVDLVPQGYWNDIGSCKSHP